MAVLDTNDQDATTTPIAVSTGTLVSLFVVEKTGGRGKFRVQLQASPDSGTSWINVGNTLSKTGHSCIPCVATEVRAKVVNTQGAASTVDVFVLTR